MKYRLIIIGKSSEPAKPASRPQKCILLHIL